MKEEELDWYCFPDEERAMKFLMEALYIGEILTKALAILSINQSGLLKYVFNSEKQERKKAIEITSSLFQTLEEKGKANYQDPFLQVVVKRGEKGIVVGIKAEGGRVELKFDGLAREYKGKVMEEGYKSVV